MADDVRGVQFPEVDGSRSTTATGTAVFADAARILSDDLARAIEHEEDWRHNYIHHLRHITEAEVRNPDGSSKVPATALRAVHDRMVFVRDGETSRLSEAVGRSGHTELRTVTVEGDGDPSRELEVPYRGSTLRDDHLRAQLEGWVTRGIAEPSFAEAVGAVLDNPDWLNLDDHRFVLLGAGAELGPLDQLTKWGADLVAVDIPSERVWQRILRSAQAGAGRVAVPVRGTSEVTDVELARRAGADLITELPEIARWLDGIDGQLVIGNYVYADGADNVRVSAAVDTIIEHLGAARQAALAVLATPTDVYGVPRAAAEESRGRYEQRGPLAKGMAAVSGGKLYAPNYRDDPAAGRPMNVADAQVPQQGPNYALAKHLHRWRARDARMEGIVSSINVAPPTATRSVTKNRLLAAAYKGAPRFDVEVFQPDTANTLMAAMLVHDLRNPSASSQPGVELDHPLEHLTLGANHGGLWRIPFAPRSVLGIAALGGMVGLGR